MCKQIIHILRISPSKCRPICRDSQLPSLISLNNICLIDIRSKSKEQLNERRAGLSKLPCPWLGGWGHHQGRGGGGGALFHQRHRFWYDEMYMLKRRFARLAKATTSSWWKWGWDVEEGHCYVLGGGSRFELIQYCIVSSIHFFRHRGSWWRGVAEEGHCYVSGGREWRGEEWEECGKRQANAYRGWGWSQSYDKRLC